MSWTKDELIAYILLYAANANYNESNLERNVIANRVDRHTFQRVHDEFNNDNDYQSIQKILSGIEKHNYSKDTIDTLLTDLKTMFFADGEFDHLEKNMFLYLKKILKK